MEETSQKECKKREKYGMIEFLKKLENEWLTFKQGLLQIYYKGISWIFALYIYYFYIWKVFLNLMVFTMCCNNNDCLHVLLLILN